MSDSSLPIYGAFKIELYQAELKSLPSGISTLLSAYSGIPVEQQKEHITTVRDRAYRSYPYPCLGRWRFLDLDLASHPLYHSDILPMLKEVDKKDWIFLDLGCCLGQDMRKLLFDGVDPGRVYGADLRPEFIETGYELFRDEYNFPRTEHFIAPADVFDFSSESELSRKCDGKVRILHTTAVFHLFNWEEQVKMAQRCLQLMTSKLGRVLICGAQVGNIEAGEHGRHRGGGSRYRHNAESWKRLWEEVVQMEPSRGKVKSIEVKSDLEERNMDRFKEDLKKLQDQHEAQNDAPKTDSNTDQRQIGDVEKGFRWHKWWVWVDFA